MDYILCVGRHYGLKCLKWHLRHADLPAIMYKCSSTSMSSNTNKRIDMFIKLTVHEVKHRPVVLNT